MSFPSNQPTNLAFLKAKNRFQGGNTVRFFAFGRTKPNPHRSRESEERGRWKEERERAGRQRRGRRKRKSLRDVTIYSRLGTLKNACQVGFPTRPQEVAASLVVVLSAGRWTSADGSNLEILTSLVQCEELEKLLRLGGDDVKVLHNMAVCRYQKSGRKDVEPLCESNPSP
jgi:hypothetical protein